MKKLLFLFALILSNSVVMAELDKDFRRNFTEILPALCHSGIDYVLEDAVGLGFDEDQQGYFCEAGKCAEYHETLTCLFDDGLGQSLQGINKTVSLAVTEKDNFENDVAPNTLQIDEARCQGKKLGDLQARQAARGFTSTCDEAGSLDAYQYSPCRVAETVLLEFCGYQKFLITKALDRQSFKTEYPDYAGLDVPERVQVAYLAELEKTEIALTEMLETYRKLSQKYRLYAWLRGFYYDGKPLQQQLVEKFLNNLNTFPAKFPNVSKPA